MSKRPEPRSSFGAASIRKNTAKNNQTYVTISSRKTVIEHTEYLPARMN